MKIFKNIVLVFLIEYHWNNIMRYRKKGEKILKDKTAFTSKQLIHMTKQIDYHGSKAFAYEDLYMAHNAIR